MPGGSQTTAFTTDCKFQDLLNNSQSVRYRWNSLQTVAANRTALQGTTQPLRSGYPNSAMKFTITNGDDPLSNSSNRNELVGLTAGAIDEVAGTTFYYGISLYLADTWVDPAGTGFWYIVAQCHGNDSNTGHSAQAMFQLLVASDLNPVSNSRRFTMRTCGGPITGGGTIPGADDIVTDLGPHVYNTWIDFIFKIVWASDVEGTGHVTVWKRIVGVDSSLIQIADYAAPTMYSASGVTQTAAYWKRGSYILPNSLQGSGTNFYYGSPFVKASTMADAAIGSFGQAS